MNTYIKIPFFIFLLLYFCRSSAAVDLDIDIRASSWKGKSQADTVIIFSDVEGETAYTAPADENNSKKFLVDSGKYKVLGGNSIQITWSAGTKTIALFELDNKQVMILANSPFEETMFSLIKKGKSRSSNTSKDIDTKSAKNLTKIINKVQAAYYGFIDKYRQIPGDWDKDKAAAAIPGINTGGNGDGKINDSSGPWTEPLAAWEHLSKSGFIEGAYVGGNKPLTKKDANKAPRNPFGGYMLLLRSSDYYAQSNASKERMLFLIGNGIPVNVLAELDRITDDGLPQSGVMRISITSSSNLGSIIESNPDCISSKGDLPIYNIKKPEVMCNSVFIY
tara:strand:+ start:1832 stop:2836 length:1005 start_codon:yes stop_codon:yes gene_type:complete